MPSDWSVHRCPLQGASMLALALLAPACGSSQSATAAKVEKQIEVRKREEQPDKLLERGRAFAQIGDNTRAEQYLSGALDGGADPEVVLPLLLGVCIAERRYRVAIDYAEPHLKRRPSDFKLRFVVASLYQSIGEMAHARRELELVMRTRPDHADAHYAIAVIFRDEDEDPVKADLHFREYLRLRPQGTHAEEARASLLRDTAAAPRMPLKTVPPPTPTTTTKPGADKPDKSRQTPTTAPRAPAPQEVPP